jgi:hypothetical protein
MQTRAISVTGAIMAKVKAGCIYPAKKNNEYSKRYNHYMACMTGDFYIVDCLPCDANGNIAPGFEYGVPTNTSKFYVTRGVANNE